MKCAVLGAVASLFFPPGWELAFQRQAWLLEGLPVGLVLLQSGASSSGLGSAGTRGLWLILSLVF